jgi:hypothetical protein
MLDNETSMGDGYKSLLDYYALLVLIVGENCTQEHVHDAWSVWQAGISSDHRSLKPFAELTKEVQELDEPYRLAVVNVSKKIKETP